MGYQLRMHREIRDWLTGLRGGEPGLARPIGEAVLALLDAGESLGPPLVVPLESVLQPPDDPREALDYSYQRQLESLTKVRRGVADVATSHKRIELQVATLERQAGKLAGQRERALEAGQADLAREAHMREATVQEQLCRAARAASHPDRRGGEADHSQSAAAGQGRGVPGPEGDGQGHLHGRRGRRSPFVRPSAAPATDTDDPEAVQPDISARSASVTSTVSEILQEIRDLTPPFPLRPGPDEGSIHPPPGLMELRPGAPDDVRVGLLFAVEPPDTAVLVAWVDDPGGPPDRYRDVIELAAADCRPRARLLPPTSFPITPNRCWTNSSRVRGPRSRSAPRRWWPAIVPTPWRRPGSG